MLGKIFSTFFSINNRGEKRVKEEKKHQFILVMVKKRRERI
jgi:hypothetical protein